MNILENYLFFVGLQNQLMAISVDRGTSHYEVYKFDSLEEEWVFIELSFDLDDAKEIISNYPGSFTAPSGFVKR